MRLNMILAAALAATLACPTTAQEPTLPQVGSYQDTNIVLKGLVNTMTFDVPVLEKLFVEREANYLQLDFADVKLTDGSWIEIQSVLDGDTQRITNDDLVDGGFRSAYFNGFAVTVRMWAPPGSDAPSARVTRIDRGLERYFDPATICGPTDDRVLRSRKPICRLLIQKSGGTYVCTGWLVSTTTGGHVTAGHCLSGATGVTAQYNTPQSTTSGAIVNPPAADQYAWRSTTSRFSNAGVGSDWGVFRTSGNPYTRQLARFTFASPNTTSTHIRNGYGSASGVRNFAQKDHSGRITSITTSTIRYPIDSTGGDSGGPVYRGTWIAVGIHTHGGCTSTGGANAGTNGNLTAFRNALATVQ